MITIPTNYKSEVGLIEAIALDHGIFGDDISCNFKKHIRLYCDARISVMSTSSHRCFGRSIVTFRVEYSVHPILISEDENFIHLIFFDYSNRSYYIRGGAFNSVSHRCNINTESSSEFKTGNAIAFIERIYEYGRHLYFNGDVYRSNRIKSFTFSQTDIINSLGLIDIDGKQLMIYCIDGNFEDFYKVFPNNIFDPDCNTYEAARRLTNRFPEFTSGIGPRFIIPIKNIMDSVLGHHDYTSNLTSMDIANIFFYVLHPSKYELFSSLYSTLVEGARRNNTNCIPVSAGKMLRQAMKKNRPPDLEKKRKKRGKTIRKAAGASQEEGSPRISC